MRRLFVVWVAIGGLCSAQSFTSGSTGVDGALTLTTPGVVDFDAAALNLDADGDGIFQFTTISVGTGVTLRFRAATFNSPVYWLASGAVQIDGVLDLRGEDGHPSGARSNASASIAGSGGYGGGSGGGGYINPSVSIVPAQKGYGPGGGRPAKYFDVGAGAGPGPRAAAPGTYTGNSFMVPLIGGSGGGGGACNVGNLIGGGGGAGGGAILIASSSSIRVNGSILVTGGTLGAQNSCEFNFRGAAGDAGAIRLAANTVTGTGSLAGTARIEAVQISGTLVGVGTSTFPYGVYLPPGGSTPGTVSVISVAGVNMPPNPTGSFAAPDVAFNQPVAVPIVIRGKQVPVGTVVKVYLYSDQAAFQVFDSPPLAGTMASSETTVSAVFPTGFTRGYVTASW